MEVSSRRMTQLPSVAALEALVDGRVPLVDGRLPLVELPISLWRHPASSDGSAIE
jgi:hypothetical protein